MCLRVNHYVTILFVISVGLAGTFISACSGPKVSESPGWVETADITEADDILVLSQKMVGHWLIDEEVSDDPHKLMDAVLKNSKRLSQMGAMSSRDGSGQRSVRGAQGMPDRKDPSSFSEDTRLQALFARELEITFDNKKLVYQYQNMMPTIGPDEKSGITNSEMKPDIKPVAYPINGLPVSTDGSINIVFAEWEQQQFVIERNGPGGRILEYWTPSPAGNQLHLSMQITPNMLLETITINRLFNARK